jgi:hypothetical protein
MKKQRQTKYTKLALVCSKELAAKKKALVAAEKRLAKAQQTHQELLSEVARLDMLDRSLMAVNNGTQPPQNIKYVYTYPTWVWNPPYTYTVPNSGQWTFTTQPNWVGYNTPNPSGGTAIGSLLTSNSSGLSPMVSCTLANVSGTYTNSNMGVNIAQTTPCSNDGSSVVLTSTNSAPQWQNANDGSLVVDLTTHEPYESNKFEDEIELPSANLVLAEA